MTYGSRVGLFAEIHPIAASFAKMAKQPIPFDKIINFINKNIAARESGELPTDRNDFLSKLLELEASGKIERHDVITSLGANIAAGSDTTGLTLTAIIYYLAKNPQATLKLRQEIREFDSAGEISDPVTFTESQKMPYLQAVIKEALRIHPATGQMLSRIVPPGGAMVGGRFFPGGVEVGTSPWLTHFDKSVFGSDADVFSPERWLESPERSTKMDRQILSVSSLLPCLPSLFPSFFSPSFILFSPFPFSLYYIFLQTWFANTNPQFGAGARTCLGKNISILEMTKLVPQLYRKYNFVLDKPEEEWELNMVWFVKQKFDARIEVL